jgi:hypothetical protein
MGHCAWLASSATSDLLNVSMEEGSADLERFSYRLSPLLSILLPHRSSLLSEARPHHPTPRWRERDRRGRVDKAPLRRDHRNTRHGGSA